MKRTYIVESYGGGARSCSLLCRLVVIAITITNCDSGSIEGTKDDGGEAGACDPALACGALCCEEGQVCHNGNCMNTTGPCTAGGDCSEDARCIDGRCIPWSEFTGFPYDDQCTREVKPGVLRPQLQCAWETSTGSPGGEHAVRHTPLVADFKLSGVDRSVGPAIVVIAKATYKEQVPRVCESSGRLFILDGRTCKELYVVDSPNDEVLATVTPAAADLDGDGRAEIIAPGPSGGLLAFTYDAKQDKFVRFWQSTDPQGAPSNLGGDTCLWGGITVADLDGGTPEVFFHGAAHDSSGKIMGQIPGYSHIGWGNPMVVVDADLDGVPEVLEGFGTYTFQKGSGFALIPGWVGTGGAGFIAVADFGDFPGKAGDGPGRPEVVVVNKTVRVQTILGEEVFSATGGVGTGGPPTVADFDGDSKPEIGVAFGDKYVVYDLDCKGTPAGCAGDGILWTKASQDVSSAKTGSSVFDFNGDGRAEVVYGDECFVRVYDGPSGDVLFSQGRFSSTWQENPIVADVDGDASAEIVLVASGQCSPTYCSPWDGSFAGLPCKSADDCPSKVCDSGFCRCNADEDCGGSFSCTTPLAGTPGTGDVCRTKHEGCAPGVRVYRDAMDRWAGSRSVWNQHAYHVTNIETDGTVLPAGKVKNNWQVKGLNNFRQNVQGAVGPMPASDLTVKELSYTCAQQQVTLEAAVCNRGPAGADAGVSVTFVDSSGATLCSTTTAGFLDPGKCETVSCNATVGAKTTVKAQVNTDGAVGECNSGNNDSTPKTVQCVG